VYNELTKSAIILFLALYRVTVFCVWYHMECKSKSVTYTSIFWWG